MQNRIATQQLSVGYLKEIQILRKAEKMHVLSGSLADAIVTIY